MLWLHGKFFTHNCNAIFRNLLHYHCTERIAIWLQGLLGNVYEEKLPECLKFLIFLHFFRSCCIASARHVTHRNSENRMCSHGFSVKQKTWNQLQSLQSAIEALVRALLCSCILFQAENGLNHEFLSSMCARIGKAPHHTTDLRSVSGTR